MSTTSSEKEVADAKVAFVEAQALIIKNQLNNDAFRAEVYEIVWEKLDEISMVEVHEIMDAVVQVMERA